MLTWVCNYATLQLRNVIALRQVFRCQRAPILFVRIGAGFAPDLRDGFFDGLCRLAPPLGQRGVIGPVLFAQTKFRLPQAIVANSGRLQFSVYVARVVMLAVAA